MPITFYARDFYDESPYDIFGKQPGFYVYVLPFVSPTEVFPSALVYPDLQVFGYDGLRICPLIHKARILELKDVQQFHYVHCKLLSAHHKGWLVSAI